MLRYACIVWSWGKASFTQTLGLINTQLKKSEKQGAVQSHAKRTKAPGDQDVSPAQPPHAASWCDYIEKRHKPAEQAVSAQALSNFSSLRPIAARTRVFRLPALAGRAATTEYKVPPDPEGILKACSCMLKPGIPEGSVWARSPKCARECDVQRRSTSHAREGKGQTCNGATALAAACGRNCIARRQCDVHRRCVSHCRQAR